MSHSLTIEAPERVVSYARRQGSRFENELRIIFMAYTQASMDGEQGMTTQPWSGSAGKPKARRIGIMESVWTASSYENDRRMDDEIESMFDSGEKVFLASHDNRFAQYGDFVIEV